MPAQSDPADPTSAEMLLYLGIGAFLSLVIVATVGLSIYGLQASADTRAERSAGAEEVQAEAALDDGANIYGLRCASCHGQNGEGIVGPSFVGVTERIPDVADHEAVVRGGRAQMPAFSATLSDEQIALVVQYERTVLDAG